MARLLSPDAAPPARFSAPWSAGLAWLTAAVGAVLVAVAVVAGPIGQVVAGAIAAVGVAFAVRGYSVEGSGAGPVVRVRFLGWSRELGPVVGAERAAGATEGSVRVFGIGGLMGYVGRFRSAALGPYVAYATDPARAVVVRRRGAPPVVLTPDRPDDFVAAVRGALP